MTGIVLWTMNEWYAVEAGGVEWRCRLRGVLRKEGRTALLPVVGDQVDLEPTGEGEGVITGIGPRRSTFSRRAAGAKGAWREQVLAANIDQVVVMFAAANPVPNPRTVDRFLVVAEANELPAVLLVNKVDLVDQAAAHATFDVYARVGYPVHFVSAIAGMGLDGLPALLAGRVSLVSGPSGVGKSSLINALLPGIDLRTATVSQSLRKGRHTTMVGSLYRLPWGGYIADTPGLRELAPWDIPPSELSDCFPEMRPYQDECRWSGCLHRNEQDCAVRAAVACATIDPRRYDSYLRILDGALEAERIAARAGRTGH